MAANGVRVVISPRADRDLQAIWLTIASDDTAAATRVVRAIGARISLLANHPRLGPRRPDIGLTIRVRVEGRHLILYEIRPDTDDRPIDKVEIVRVVDGRRDLTGLF